MVLQFREGVGLKYRLTMFVDIFASMANLGVMLREKVAHIITVAKYI